MVHLLLMNVDINSTSNPKVKWVKGLHKNNTRRSEGVFLVEGAKEIAYALDGGYLPRTFFVCPEIFGDKDVILNSVENLQKQSNQILNQARHGDMPVVQDDNNVIFTVSKEVYEKIAYRGGVEGILGIFEVNKKSLDALNFGDNPFFLVIESVEKPGNLGAIIRSADGAGADGIIICDEKTDIFNPNVIRSSVGTVFTKQIVAASSKEVYDFLEKHEITAFGAVLSKESKKYTEADLTSPCAVVLGTEHEGLSDFWKDRVQPLIIPMLGQNDSLNVSNAAAILAYEVVRQRSLVDSEQC
jgi:TrmH family RNA methyltransferase